MTSNDTLNDKPLNDKPLKPNGKQVRAEDIRRARRAAERARVNALAEAELLWWQSQPSAASEDAEGTHGGES